MSKETALLIISLIWGIYAIVVGIFTVYNRFNNDLVWISIITAISGTTGAHIAVSMSTKGLTIQAQGSSPPGPPKQ